MPLYEFVCRQCNKDFETIVPASRRDAVACPDCGNEKTARKISLASPARVSHTVAANTSFGQGCGAESCCGGGCSMMQN